MTPTEPLNVDEAVDIVARSVAYAGVQRWIEDYGWAEYPDIGEHDWQRVADEAMGLVSMTNPDTTDYEQAYDLLTERAQGVEA